MEELIKVLKVYEQYLEILHRNLIGNGWFADHEQLGNYYNMIKNMKDDIIEISIGLGINEPSMEESLKIIKEIEIINRNAKQSYKIVQELFNDIIIQINRINNVPADIINKLQEYQEILRKEAYYKLARAIKE